MEHLKKICFFIALIIITLFIWWNFSPTILELQTKHATLSGVPLQLVIRDTEATRAQGLSGLPQISEGTGMFFVFDEPDYLGFWMKDMKFPIDIIWFDEFYRVVNIQENLSPGTYPQVFTPQVLAQYVLEVPAHFATKHGVKIGDQISF